MSRVSGMVERVRLMLLRGELPAGGRVVELLLAERLHISHGTVREVLRQLEGDGLLVANPAGGMRVVELDGSELAETLEVRASLEALTAELAARRARAGDVPDGALGGLQRLVDAAAAATGLDAAVADRHLHRAIDALAGNRPAHEALTRIWDRLLVAAAQAGDRPARGATADREHRELVTAITAGDAAEAAAIARRHVLAELPAAAVED
jgi:DNA-binding GntR family transcriptional regulator